MTAATAIPSYLDIERKHEVVLLFDVKNGNPNGDPDAGNMPRTNPINGNGIVTDVCLKRKIREYFAMIGQQIFIRQGTNLNVAIDDAVKESGAQVKSGRTNSPEETAKARKLMCQKYIDIRTFGGVLSSGKNAGQVRGAWTISFSESLDPITPVSLTITRCAAADKNTEDREKELKTMGNKQIIPYGLYRCNIYFNPLLAEDVGMSIQDMKLFFEALQNIFEFDRSASRGEMALQGLWVFTHADKLGSYPSHKLLKTIRVEKDPLADIPESLDDYRIVEDFSKLPDTVEVVRLV